MSRVAVRIVIGLLAFVPLACAMETPAPKAEAPAQIAVVQEAPPQAPRSTEPTEIELYDAKVLLEDDKRIRFEVKYRVTKGTADKYYELAVSFPGTNNHVGKSMSGAGKEGVIKDGFTLREPPVTTFEMQLSEAPTQMDPYKKVSNVVTGKVESTAGAKQATK